jgi:excisionase family DNA binding protein
MPVMTDPLPDAVPDVPDAEPLLTAQEVATLLGVSERTIRRRINAGELPSAKVAGQYRIPASAVGRSPVADAGRAGQPAGHVRTVIGDAGQGAGQSADRAGQAPVVPDIEPLATLIGDLSRENRQLAEAAAVWQFRAMQAEERLKALTAGDAVLDTPPTRSAPSGAADTTDTTDEPLTGLRAWWARLWGRS